MLAVVVGALAALLIYALAIRDGDPGPTAGPAAPLTQAERDSLGRFHRLATTSDFAYSAEELNTTCAEVTELVATKPFGPFDTSAHPGGALTSRLSPLPGSAHWAAASDLERLASGGWLLRQAVLRTLTTGDAAEVTSAVQSCHSRLLDALGAATA